MTDPCEHFALDPECLAWLDEVTEQDGHVPDYITDEATRYIERSIREAWRE